MHVVDFSDDVALTAFAILLGVGALFVLFFLVFLPIHRTVYRRLDHKGVLVTTEGRVLEKRYNDGAYSAVIQVDSIIVNMPLPYEVFRSIQEGEEIDLEALYGKLSKNILTVKPAVHHVDTYA